MKDRLLPFLFTWDSCQQTWGEVFTLISLFSPLSLLIGDHKKGSRERGKKEPLINGVQNVSKYRDRGQAEPGADVKHLEEILHCLFYVVAFLLHRYEIHPHALHGLGVLRVPWRVFVYFQTQSAKRPCSKHLSAEKCTSFTTPFKNLSN